MNQHFKQKVLQWKKEVRGTNRQLKVVSPVDQEREVFRKTLYSPGREKIRTIVVDASHTGHTSGT